MRISDINKDVRFLGTVLQLFSTPSSEAAIKKLALISSKIIVYINIIHLIPLGSKPLYICNESIVQFLALAG